MSTTSPACALFVLQATMEEADLLKERLQAITVKTSRSFSVVRPRSQDSRILFTYTRAFCSFELHLFDCRCRRQPDLTFLCGETAVTCYECHLDV